MASSKTLQTRGGATFGLVGPDGRSLPAAPRLPSKICRPDATSCTYTTIGPNRKRGVTILRFD